MTPLKVTARMGEPVIYYHDGLHLDGLLAYGAYIEHIRNGGEDLPPISSPWAVDFELPLAKWSRPVPEGAEVDARLLNGDGDLWGWCASAAIADWVAHGKMEFRKRPDIARMARYTAHPSHHLGAGPFKAFDVAYPTELAFKIEWYALGDRERVEALLQDVTHIGKKHNVGMGKVLEWTVDDTERDWSVERDGALMRRMPRDGGRPGTIRAPYHHPSRLVPCAEVGSAA